MAELALETADGRRWAERLDSRLQALWAEIPTADGVPGAVVRVSDGRSAHTFTAGRARADGPQPMGPADPFHIASVGKAMTAVLLLQQVEAGLLSVQALDAPVRDLAALADLVALIPPLSSTVNGGVTLRQMLQHTSGLRDAFSDDGRAIAGPKGPAPGSLSRELARLGREGRLSEQGAWPAWGPGRASDPHGGVLNWFVWGGGAASTPVFPSGERFHYSDTAYMLMALLVERLAGRPYAALLRERIFEPLAMRSTYLACSTEAPQAWARTVSDFSFGGRPAFSAGLDVSWDWGGGGQISSAEDLDRFLRGLLEGRLFRDAASLRQMFDFAAPPGMPDGCVGLGLGVRKLRSPGGVEMIGHAGAWSVQAFHVPQWNVSITGTYNRPMSDHPRLRTWVFEAADSLIPRMRAG